MRLIILLVSLCLVLFAAGQRKFSLGDALINSTVKVDAIKKEIRDGKVLSYTISGTGFFFDFMIDSAIVPVIVTNRHIVEGSINGVLYIKIADTSGFPIYGQTQKLNVPFSNRWLFHPDNSVDIAIYPIAPLFNDYYEKTGKKLFNGGIPEQLIPNDSVKGSLNAIEDVYMIGYPYGLRDTINDLPIVRKGITATPIYLNYNKKQEFLIDMPVFFGSSGSPILVNNNGAYTSSNGLIFSNGGRAMLVGINRATYTKDFDGKI